VVWDPDASKTISAKTHHMNLDVNVFEGMRVTGLPVVTLSQGKVAWQNGQLRVERGAGRCVRRPTHHPVFGSTEMLRQARRPKPVKRRVSLQQTP
jgi:dihydropyrimidinase